MNMRLPLAGLFGIIAALGASGATEFNWPGHGTISFDVPGNWTLQGKSAGGLGFYFRATTQSKSQAVMQISLVETAPGKPVRDADLKGLLEKVTAVLVPASVEQKVVPRGMLLAQGSGYWAEFTDSNLVDKPPVPGDFKKTRSAVIALDEHALVVATMQFDEIKADEPAAMLGIVSSMRMNRGTVVEGATPKGDTAPLEVTAPKSDVQLVLGIEGLDRDTFITDVRSEDSAYFIVNRTKPNLNLSGWLEPASKYEGIRKLWQNDSSAMSKGGLPEANNVTFGKHGEWEIVAYDNRLGDAGTSFHIRA